MIFAKIKNYFRKLPLLSRLSDESRIQQRYKVVDASILLREHQTSVNGEVVNISKTGMAFQHAEFLPHETFELDIIANDKTIAKNITCSLVWRRQAGLYIKYGVHFEGLTKEQKDRIEFFYLR